MYEEEVIRYVVRYELQGVNKFLVTTSKFVADALAKRIAEFKAMTEEQRIKQLTMKDPIAGLTMQGIPITSVIFPEEAAEILASRMRTQNIPLFIADRNGGNAIVVFDQKYNSYIKSTCELLGLTRLMIDDAVPVTQEETVEYVQENTETNEIDTSNGKRKIKAPPGFEENVEEVNGGNREKEKKDPDVIHADKTNQPEGEKVKARTTNFQEARERQGGSPRAKQTPQTQDAPEQPPEEIKAPDSEKQSTITKIISLTEQTTQKSSKGSLKELIEKEYRQRALEYSEATRANLARESVHTPERK